MKHSTSAPTIAEAERITCMLKLGCIVCKVAWGIDDIPAEVHHILDGNKRMGHWFSLPLCAGHHRGYWPDWELLKVARIVGPPISIASGRKLFNEHYGTEREIWTLVQHKLELDATWPTSKRVPRQAA